MLGPPGAGKGTQAGRFAQARQVPRISTGDVLRQARQANPDLDKQARATMDAGRLVDDDVVIGIVRRRLAEPDAREGFVLDGFPRTLNQAEALDHLLDDRQPLVVVDIEVPDTTLLERLQTRRICAKCGMPATAVLAVCSACGGPLIARGDDDARVVRERLRVYEQESRPIVEFYRRRSTFRSVDGDQPQDAVAADISSAVASVLGAR
ncbi:MAG: adenylate kinase [Acidobacteria bacterium SCN 69-37]|nr:MAG: adenylate kinase [Acidobacteria bacterium SCN 69-37]